MLKCSFELCRNCTFSESKPSLLFRTSGKVEDDLIIFPDDIEFVKVPACTTGRVFVLKFKSSSRRLFFWMQEPKDDKVDHH